MGRGRFADGWRCGESLAEQEQQDAYSVPCGTVRWDSDTRGEQKRARVSCSSVARPLRPGIAGCASLRGCPHCLAYRGATQSPGAQGISRRVRGVAWDTTDSLKPLVDPRRGVSCRSSSPRGLRWGIGHRGKHLAVEQRARRDYPVVGFPCGVSRMFRRQERVRRLYPPRYPTIGSTPPSPRYVSLCSTAIPCIIPMNPPYTTLFTRHKHYT